VQRLQRLRTRKPQTLAALLAAEKEATMDDNPLRSYRLYTYSLGAGVKGVAPPGAPRETGVTLYSTSSRRRPEDGRTEWTYASSNPEEFPAPPPSDNQREACAAFEKTIADAGWSIAHDGNYR
jgi:hypothetical protein